MYETLLFLFYVYETLPREIKRENTRFVSFLLYKSLPILNIYIISHKKYLLKKKKMAQLSPRSNNEGNISAKQTTI